ncbi:MAG: hypothetical protein IJX78_03835 [Bacilli bacterium]|nr:hypothetical protein [Bacilli bacterium]
MLYKRPFVTEEKRVNRKKIMNDRCRNNDFEYNRDYMSDIPNGLESGNKKTLDSGTNYDKIFIWNMPYVSTCPGMTKWCINNCYNADNREDVYPIKQWIRNLHDFLYQKEKLYEVICNQISLFKGQKVAIRFHSSGDFFSVEYIDFWIKIAKRFPSVHFWGYTRSWSVSSLREKIIELNSLGNVTLFASVDDFSQIDKFEQLNKSFVLEKENFEKIINNSNYFICPEQIRLTNGCADCGNCITNKAKKDIVFIVH